MCNRSMRNCFKFIIYSKIVESNMAEKVLIVYKLMTSSL